MRRIDHSLLSPSLGSHKTLSSFHYGQPGASPKVYVQASLHAAIAGHGRRLDPAVYNQRPWSQRILDHMEFTAGFADLRAETIERLHIRTGVLHENDRFAALDPVVILSQHFFLALL